jgi:hypothetical protein
MWHSQAIDVSVFGHYITTLSGGRFGKLQSYDEGLGETQKPFGFYAASGE